MKARRFTAVVLAVGIAAGAAACGGDESVVTVTTDELPATTAGTTSTTPTTLAAPTTAPEPTTEATTAATVDLTLAERLPPDDAMPATNPGTARNLPAASDLTTALYSPGDPAATPAADALEAAGYAGGILRDDTGTDPRNTVALFRSYVMELGGDTQAQAEVVRSVEEVLRTTALDTNSFPVPGIPGASGVSAQGSQNGQSLAVMFIAFPVGPYVYGLQAVATSPDGIDADRMLAIAQQQYADGTGG